MSDENIANLRDLTKSAFSFGLGLTLFGMQEAVHLLQGKNGEESAQSAASRLSLPTEDRLEDLFKSTYEAGMYIQEEFLDSLSHYLLLDALYSPNTALRLSNRLFFDVQEALRFFIPNSDSVIAWQELMNKVDAYQLVKSVQEKLKLPRDGEFSLSEYVEKAYDLGPYAALWAVEGLGHDYADSVRERGENLDQLLVGKNLKSIPDKAYLMLHAGMGLSFAQNLMKDFNSSTTDEEINDAIDEFMELCQKNSSPGYRGAAIESLGLVVRTFHSELMPAVDRCLSKSHEEAVGFFWHGAGRAVYFLIVNFLPYRDPIWRAVEIGRKEAPHEVARLNLMAGTSWALTIVNMRQPWVMKSVLSEYGEELSYEDSFSNGIASSIIMKYDTTPDDIYVEPFMNFQPDPSPSRLNELWELIIREPIEKAINVYHPALKKKKNLEAVGEYRNIEELI